MKRGGYRDPALELAASGRHGVAYLCERFPSFLQMFVYREVEEMIAQQMHPLLFSIREAEEKTPGDLPLASPVHYLPPDEVLVERVRALRADGRVPGRIWEVFQGWSGRGNTTDKMRLYQAHYVGTILQRLGVRHVHAHFAGIAARNACWVQRFFGISYSFTAHANDVFCYGDFPITLEALISEARFVATESRFSGEWLRRKFPAQSGKFEQVYNGIRPGVIDSPSSPEPGAPPLILSVGRYVEKKGFDDLIDACALLRDRGVRFLCRMVGGGPLQAALQARIHERGLGDLAELAGPRSEREVQQLLAQAQLFVLACRTESDGGMDNLPTVIMEAMAAGRAVVSTQLAAVPEMVTHEQTGLLSAERDVAGLASAMERLLGDPQLAAAMGAAGRRRVEQEFAADVTARKLKRLLIRRGRAVLPLRAWRTERGLIAASLRNQLWRF